MSAIDEKLEKFTAMITSDAQADSQRILDEITRVSEASMAAAEEKSLAYAYQYIKSTVARIRLDASRTISRKVMENKRAIYALKLKLWQRVLDEAKQRIQNFTQTPAYAERLVALMNEALSSYEGSATEIYLRPQDMGLVPVLRKAAQDQPVTFVEGAFRMGGLMALCPEKKRQIDSTYDLRFEESKVHFYEQLPTDTRTDTATQSA